MSLLAGGVSVGWSATGSADAWAVRAATVVDWLAVKSGGNGGDANPPPATSTTPWRSATATTWAAMKIDGPDGGLASDWEVLLTTHP